MNIIRWFDRHIEELLLTILSTVMVTVIFVQVVMRQLDNSLSWSEELARFCFIWLIYIGISYGVKKQRHIKVDVILVLLNQKGKVIVNVISTILFMAFAVFVIIYGFEIANKLLGFGQTSPALQIPMGLVYLSAPIGMGLTLIRLIQNLIKHIRVLQGKEKFEEPTIV